MPRSAPPSPGSAPDADLEIFLAAPPGLEPVLRDEARALAFADPVVAPGGVSVRGDWREAWRANLSLRGAARVLVRVARFPAAHLAQLDKRARRVDWAALLRSDAPVRVEAATKRSRIYHSGAAAARVAAAIRDATGATVSTGGASPEAEEAAGAAVRALVRIDRNLCEISLDASGAPLHKRGFKLAMAKAPMRETLAALFLRACGYDGREPVLDPMCGSGTFVIEAAEIAAGLAPGRERRFAFERFAGFDREAWAALRRAEAPADPAKPRCFGSDRDAGAVEAATANAARAGVGGWTRFARRAVSEITPPEGVGPGLVIVNPPYGARIGEAGRLPALYGALGAALRARFSGWRVGLATSEPGLARAAELGFAPPGPPVPHGALKVRLYQARID